jgi:hypothetical protein
MQLLVSWMQFLASVVRSQISDSFARYDEGRLEADLQRGAKESNAPRINRFYD